jgi:hypothetical protein
MGEQALIFSSGRSRPLTVARARHDQSEHYNARRAVGGRMGKLMPDLAQTEYPHLS